MIRIIRQILFGKRVFFKRLTFKNIVKILSFILKRIFLRKSIPFSVVCALTYKCQCRCVHCSVGDCSLPEEELSTNLFKKTIDEIDTFGPIKITFFGGEPLVHKDIVELIAYASNKGIRTSLDTNGIALNENNILAIKNAGIGNINVSIDSAHPEIHDKLRKYPGCHSAAVNALRLCVKHKIPCLISTYASNRSVKSRDLEEIIIFAKKEKINGVKILFPILSGRWRAEEKEALTEEGRKYLRSLLDPSYVYIEDALEMVRGNGKGCSALRKNLLYISPYGDIQPCPAIPITFGNIKNDTFTAIAKNMMTHSFFKNKAFCSGCLMNEPLFRKKYFQVKEQKRLPFNVDKFL